MIFYIFFIKFTTSSSSSSDDEDFLGRINRHRSLDDLYNPETLSEEKKIKKTNFERFESLYISESKDLKLQFGVLIEGKILDRSYAFRNGIFSGVASIGLKKNAGYQKDKGSLVENVRVLVNKDGIPNATSQILTFMLPVNIYENLKTKYISVPVIFSNEKLTIWKSSTHLYNLEKNTEFLFNLLLKKYNNFTYPEDRQKIIDNLNSFCNKSNTEIESQFKIERRRFLFFENNFDKIKQVSKKLVEYLEQKKRLSATSLDSFCNVKITKINTNDFLTSGGSKYINIIDNTNRKLLDRIKYAFSNDCVNLLKFANNPSSTTDIYECLDRHNFPEIGIYVAFLFDFEGATLLKESDIKIICYISKNGSDRNLITSMLEKFEIFVYKDKLHLMINKVDLTRNCNLTKLKIQLNTRRITYQTDFIDLDYNKRQTN